MKIELTELENHIFHIIKSVIAEKCPETTVRAAGGWIRDKLLGKESHDIDLAVDNMTGQEFAKKINEYAIDSGYKESPISVVEANPEQSKHLETAMIRIAGLPIDIVNLRSEDYADGSRIPTMRFGTPKEDAERRDLTINALFYNVNTGEVEDFVGGLEHIEKRIAMTPLEPVKTFLDDPLRILRLMRFATKYDLDVPSKVLHAFMESEVIEAFKTKVSKERIWAELGLKDDGGVWKMGALATAKDDRILHMLKLSGLMEVIFDPTPEEMKELELHDEMIPWETDQNNAHHQFDIWEHTCNVFEELLAQERDLDPETRIVRNLTALLHDIGKRYKGIHGVSSDGIHTSYKGHEETSAVITEKVLTRLKVPARIIERTKKLIEYHLRPHILTAHGKPKAYRKFVRGFEDWNHSIDVAMADNLGKKYFTEQEKLLEIAKYEALRKRVEESLPENIQGTEIPRPINGRDLIGLGIKPGPVMGDIMRMIDETLLENPALTKDEALGIAQTFI